MFALRAMVALLLALALPAAADHGCTTWSTTTAVILCDWPTPGSCISGDIAGRYYIQQDECDQFCWLSLWVYEESNGIPGLQRGDEVYDDTCHGMIESDTIIF